MSRNMASVKEALDGLTSTPIRTALGTRSCKRPSRLAPTSEAKKLTPVGLPPGRARLATRPNLTALQRVWTNAGLESVETSVVRIRTVYSDFDDFWDSNIV